MSDILSRTFRNDKTEVPVLIVGGSLVGLSTALFLAWQGIPALLVERHADTAPYTRAGAFNQRTLELLRGPGLEPAIRERARPPERMGRIIRAESLAGREFDAHGGQGRPQPNTFTETGDISPVRAAMIGQDQLEPLIRARAVELGSDLHYSTELLSFEQDASGVSARLRERTTGREYTVRARYMVAADGNRSETRRRLGIGTHGHGTLAYWHSIAFRADLSAALRRRDMLFCFIDNPLVQGTLGGSGDRWGLVISQAAQEGEEPKPIAPERCLELVRAAVGLPDIAIELEGTTIWEVAARVADSYQRGRIFLAGDAAHVMPPMGAFGANTGIADAHNLAWKLAYVLRGEAEPALLETYEVERRPAAELAAGIALGLYAYRLSQQENSEAIARSADEMLARVLPTPGASRPDNFGVTLGYRYRSAAIISETPADDVPFSNQPEGRPGSRAPHVELERGDQQLSTLDLYGRSFVLLCGTEGKVWREAAQRVAERTRRGSHEQGAPAPLQVYTIGHNGDYRDIAGNFLAAYGITASGAVLIRPDGFMAWRAPAGVENAEDTLERILTALLH